MTLSDVGDGLETDGEEGSDNVAIEECSDKVAIEECSVSNAGPDAGLQSLSSINLAACPDGKYLLNSNSTTHID